jgi:hypothetical protein
VLETLFACPTGGAGGSPTSAGVLAAQLVEENTIRERASYEDMPDAPAQPEMPGGPFTPGTESGQVDDNDDTGSMPATGGGLLLGGLGFALIASSTRLRGRH